MRYLGVVGFGFPQDGGDGVWSDDITERIYNGSVLSVTRSNQESEKVNDDIRWQNRISIMADAFALENISFIKYVSWMESRWVVSSLDLERPRIILSLGELYNGPVPVGGSY